MGRAGFGGVTPGMRGDAAPVALEASVGVHRTGGLGVDPAAMTRGPVVTTPAMTRTPATMWTPAITPSAVRGAVAGTG